ncbi:MAG: 3-hydroxyacyl-CoA dehydrogenase NAD-binding domain-containing protein, partial [Actinomycetota bacterium]
MKLVGVIGSGIMGAGIAEVVARAGVDVVVRSRAQATAEATRNQIQASLQKQVVKGKLTQALQDEAMKRICVASELS